MLTACEPEPKGPVQVVQPESMRFETEHIRREVDIYKTTPSAIGRRRMDKAFSAFDARLRELVTLAETQTGEEQLATQRQIADLKHRREIHWTRAQTAVVDAMPVKRAEPVAERVVKAEKVRRAIRIEPPSNPQPAMTERVMKAEPVNPAWQNQRPALH